MAVIDRREACSEVKPREVGVNPGTKWGGFFNMQVHKRKEQTLNFPF
jgi:hypothetical protein